MQASPRLEGARQVDAGSFVRLITTEIVQTERGIKGHLTRHVEKILGQKIEHLSEAIGDAATVEVKTMRAHQISTTKFAGERHLDSR